VSGAMRTDAQRTMMAFLAAGVLGPVASLGVVHLSPYSAAYGFLYGLVWLLWPTWGLAVAEVSLGTLAAVTLAIVANLILFGVVGAAIACIARWRSILLAFWVTCLGVLCMWSWVGAGGSVQHVKWSPLLLAAGVCSVPFEIARTAVQPRGEGRQRE
jgi:hypothetical protein